MILLDESELTKQGFQDGFIPSHPVVSSSSAPSIIQYGSAPVLPPDYVPIRRRPTNAVIYAFQPMPWSSMRLVPPEHIPDAHEPYSICVAPNCFTPSSFITTVRRNNLEGEFVGSFEIAPVGSKVPNTVCLRGTEYPLGEALSVHPFRRNTWTWNTFARDKPVTLHWDGKEPLTCFRSKEKNSANIVARFYQKSTPPREGRAVVHAKLEITPLGHDLFDDVIMSLLIVERLRTSTSS